MRDRRAHHVGEATKRFGFLRIERIARAVDDVENTAHLAAFILTQKCSRTGATHRETSRGSLNVGGTNDVRMKIIRREHLVGGRLKGRDQLRCRKRRGTPKHPDAIDHELSCGPMPVDEKARPSSVGEGDTNAVGSS